MFLKYSLDYFNTFNALLQSDKVMIHKLRDLSKKLLEDICQNYLKAEVVEHIYTAAIDDPRIYLDRPYLGPECESYVRSLAPQYQVGVPQLREKCLSFYV